MNTVAMPIVTQQEFPYGVLCHECKDEIGVGMPYAEQFDGLTADGDLAIVTVVCVPCGIRRPMGNWELVELD